MKRMGYRRGFLVYSFLLLVLLHSMVHPVPAAAGTLTAGRTTVGTNVYPDGVGGMHVVGVDEFKSNPAPLAFENALIDPAGGFAYFGCVANPGKVIKVRLSDFAVVATLTFNPGEGTPYCSLLDKANGFAYFGTYNGPAKIVRVRLSDFSRVDAITLEPCEENIGCAVLDPIGGFAYFGTSDNSWGKVIKVRLSDFKRVGAVSLASDEMHLNSAVIDPKGEFAYFGIDSTNPGKIVKIRLSDLTKVGYLTLSRNEYWLDAAVIDQAGEFAYFAASPDMYEAKILKIRLSDFKEVDSLVPVSRTADPICSAAIDTQHGFAYFGIRLYPDPGKVAKIRLSDFKVLSLLDLTTPDAGITCQVVDPAAGFGYLGTNQNRIIKYGLDSIRDSIRATKLTLPESAAIKDMRIYSHQAGGDLRLALYDNSSTTRKLLWQAGPIANTTANGWINVPISSGTPATLNLRGGSYWLAFNSDSNSHFASYTPGAPGDGFKIDQALDTVPATLAASAVQATSESWSHYLTYTPTFINTPPTAPTITLSTTTPGTLDSITAAAASTDPDTAVGDSVTAYRYEWSLGGVVKSTSSTLSAALTARGQQWTCTAWACDTHGEWSAPGQATVTIVNTPPTQPLVEIRPKPARAGEALVVDVQTYSADPDGDTVAYDFNWFKSTDGGKTWIHKVELDGSSQVAGPYIIDGDLWEVHYVPYEKILTDTPQKSAAPGATAPAAPTRVEGKFAWDRAYIGANNPPKLALDQPVARREASGLMLLNLGWNFSDADGDYCTLDLDWTDLKNSGYQVVARSLSARQGSFNGFVAMPWPWDRPVAIHGVIRDTKGAVAQQISATVRLLPPAPGVVVDYLLGKSASPAGLDVNLDRKVTIADVLASGAVALPATPATPVPADGARAVSRTPRLAWSGTAHVQSYQLYLWRPREARPSMPLATLSAGTTAYQVKSALLPGTTYCWQVIAVSGTLKTTGPVWAFTTQP